MEAHGRADRNVSGWKSKRTGERLEVSFHITCSKGMDYYDQQKKWTLEVMKKDKLKRAQSSIVKATILNKVMQSLNGHCTSVMPDGLESWGPHGVPGPRPLSEF